MSTNALHRSVPAAVLAGSLLATTAAWAGCTVPFTMNTPTNLPTLVNDRVGCVGPWVRNSGDHPVTAGLYKDPFYCAHQTIFSMWGKWVCFVNWDGPGGLGQSDVEFCLEPGMWEVDLSFDGTNLTVDIDDTCKSTATASFLGHPGTAGTTAGDADVFDFSGTAGERVRVTLDRDGSAGGTDGIVRLELKSVGGQALAGKSGRLPIELVTNLADAGLQVHVLSAGGQGSRYRGGYIVEVKPAGGEVGDRLLRPRPGVEP